MEKKKKKPTIKTLEDEGTKVDLVDFGNGRHAFFYRQEKFLGVEIPIIGARLGWSEKYNVVSPGQLSQDTISTMTQTLSTISGAQVNPDDISVIVGEKKSSKEDLDDK